MGSVLTWLAIAAGCGPGEGELLPVDLGGPALGARPLLILTPQSRQATPMLSEQAFEHLEALETLERLDASTAEVLRKALSSGLPAVEVAAAEKGAELIGASTKADPARVDAAEALLAGLVTGHADASAAARLALDALTTDQRQALLERALSSTEPKELHGVACAWPRLLPPEGLADGLPAMLSRLPPRLVFIALAGDCGGAAGDSSLSNCGRTPSPAAGGSGGCPPGENCGRTPSPAAGGAEGRPPGVNPGEPPSPPLADPAHRAAAVACALGVAPVADLTPLLEFLPAAPGPVASALTRNVSALQGQAAAVVTALDAVAQAATDGDGPAVAEARAAFGVSDGYASLAVLVRAGSPALRREALRALGRLGETKRLAHSSLAAALDKASEAPDGATRAHVAEILGLVDDGRVLPILTLLVRDGSTEVRAAAAYAAGRSGNRKFAKVLVEHGTLDSSDRVRDAVFAALEHLIHGHPLPPPSMVTAWLTDPEPKGDLPYFGRDFVAWREWYQNP